MTSSRPSWASMFKFGYFAPVLLFALAACDNSSTTPPKQGSAPPDAAKKIAPAKSQVAEEEFGDCRDQYRGTPEVRIAACSAILIRPSVDKDVLFEAYRRRANAFSEKRDYGRAIDDHSKALEVN